MKANRKIINEANKITSKYNGFQKASDISKMYDELAKINISTGMLFNGNRSCEWYINGEEVENSLFIYTVYKPFQGNNDYTIYFS